MTTVQERVRLIARLPMRNEPLRWGRLTPAERAFIDAVRGDPLRGLDDEEAAWLRRLVETHGA